MVRNVSPEQLRINRVVGTMLSDPSKVWKAADLARATSLTLGSVNEIVRSLRYKGQIAFDRIQLSPSMIERPSVASAVKQEAVPAAAQPSLAEQVHAEALAIGANRAAARSSGSIRGPAAIRSTKLIEQLQGALVATPSDLVETTRRAWPELWARCVARSRAEQASPGSVLIAAIERGLEQ